MLHKFPGSSEGIDGLDHAEVETQLGQAQINIKPNYLALSRYGLTVEDVMQVIRYGIGEEAVTQKIEGVKRFGIVAKLKDAKQDINTLKSLILRSQSGKSSNTGRGLRHYSETGTGFHQT